MDHFKALQKQYRVCSRCPALCQSRSQVVFGSGNPSAQVLFIGEAPGATEDKEGIPFCGMSGKILQDLLGTIGLHRDDVFITNTLLCRPENNRNPEKMEVDNCRERLDQLIMIMKPKVIVTIGNFATERILKKKGITQLRGKIHTIELAGRQVVVVPVIHPANYLYNGRNPVIFEQMKADFVAIGVVLNHTMNNTNNNSTRGNTNIHSSQYQRKLDQF